MQVLLAIITLTFAALSWMNTRHAIILLTALLPSYLLRTELANIPTTLLEGLVVALIIVWGIKNYSIWCKKKFWLKKEHLPILLLLITSTISIVISPNTVAALGVWKAYFVEPILLFLILKHELHIQSVSAKDLFYALSISAVILSLIGIAQWVTGQGIPIPWDIERRITSVFNYPNALGLFLGPIATIAFLKIRSYHDHFWIITGLLSIIVIVLAKSEAALVALIATLICAGLYHIKTRKATVILTSILAIAILLSPMSGWVVEKLTLQDYSGGVRISQWQETAALLENNWLWGAGLSGYPTVIETYHEATHLEIFQYPHNIFLNIWVELGLLGILSFVVLVWEVSRRWFKNQTTVIAGFALLQMIIHGLVDVPYFKNDLAMLTWMLLAILWAYALEDRKQES